MAVQGVVYGLLFVRVCVCDGHELLTFTKLMPANVTMIHICMSLWNSTSVANVIYIAINVST